MKEVIAIIVIWEIARWGLNKLWYIIVNGK